MKLEFSSLRYDEFEQLCADLLRKECLINVLVTSGPGGGDLGIDIYAEELVNLKTGETQVQKIAVQCKNYSKNIGNEEVSKMINNVRNLGYDRLLIICPMDLTTGAKKLIAENMKSRHPVSVSLWSYNKLEELLLKHKDVQERYFGEWIHRLKELSESGHKHLLARIRIPLCLFITSNLENPSTILALGRNNPSLCSIRKSLFIASSTLALTYPSLFKQLSFDSFLPGLALIIQSQSERRLYRHRKLIDVALVHVSKNNIHELNGIVTYLKSGKIPFVIALDIDDLHWKDHTSIYISEQIGFQPTVIQEALEKNLTAVITALNKLSFPAQAFWRVRDFTKEVAIVPVSLVQNIGLAEVFIILFGLCNLYLGRRLMS